jgi:hypothetical protein
MLDHIHQKEKIAVNRVNGLYRDLDVASLVFTTTFAFAELILGACTIILFLGHKKYFYT